MNPAKKMLYVFAQHLKMITAEKTENKDRGGLNEETKFGLIIQKELQRRWLVLQVISSFQTVESNDSTILC